ncbi:MAG: hypothetical protein ACLUBZ_00115 [Ruthenibacterium lactatiformans]|jgi:hypothetical protein|uniref:hypothetical protein n=1 Tax=Ruthenibacterium lactatiformans TaxID=1550024 RepID=UPI003990EF44
MPRKKSTSKIETPLEQLSPLEAEGIHGTERDAGTEIPQAAETNPVACEEIPADQTEAGPSALLPAAGKIVVEAEIPGWPEAALQKNSENSDYAQEGAMPDVLSDSAEPLDKIVLDIAQQAADGPPTEDSLLGETEAGDLFCEEVPLQAEALQVSEELSSGLQDDISDTVQVSKFGHPEDKADEKDVAIPRSKSAREDFFALNIKRLDRKLSSKQQEEWENIYTSFRSRSALHGIISGKEIISLKVFNEATGSNEIKEILCLTVMQYRVKVLIPETELWADGQVHPRHIVSHMVGAQTDYVITNIDKVGGCAIASRKQALELRRNRFKFARRGNQPGDRILVNVLVVGPKLMRVECWGHDMLLTPRDLSYASIADLREEYHSGQQLEAVIKEYDAENDKLKISVKEANPNPFDDADLRHPVGSECRAIIGGRYRGGVFCRLPDDVTCMCLLSNIFTEYDCSPGDPVLVRITHYDYTNKHVYGRIVLKL